MILPGGGVFSRLRQARNGGRTPLPAGPSAIATATASAACSLPTSRTVHARDVRRKKRMAALVTTISTLPRSCSRFLYHGPEKGSG